MTNCCSRWWFALNMALISMIPCWCLNGNLHLSCNVSTIGVQVSFSQVLSGVLFAKGHLHEERCRMFFIGSKASLGLSATTCGSTVAEIHGKPFLRNTIVIRAASKIPTTAHVEEIFCGLNRVENHTFQFSINVTNNFKSNEEKTVQKRTRNNSLKTRVQTLSNHFLNYKQQINEQQGRENLIKRTLRANTLTNHTETNVNFTINTTNVPTEISVKELIVNATEVPDEQLGEIDLFDKESRTEADPFADVEIVTIIDKDYFTDDSHVDDTITTYSLMHGNMTSYSQTDASTFIEEMNNNESEIKFHMENVLNASSRRFSRLEAEYNIGLLSHSDIQLALDTSNLENETVKFDTNAEGNNEKSHTKSNIGVLLFSDFLTTNIPSVSTDISTHSFISSSESFMSTTEINFYSSLSGSNNSGTLIKMNSTEDIDNNLRVVNDSDKDLIKTVNTIGNTIKEKDVDDDSFTLIMNSTEVIDDNVRVINDSDNDVIKTVNSKGNTTKEKDPEDNLNEKIAPFSKQCVQRFVFIIVSSSLSIAILILIAVCVGLLLYTKKLKKKHDLDSYLLYSFY